MTRFRVSEGSPTLLSCANYQKVGSSYAWNTPHNESILSESLRMLDEKTAKFRKLIAAGVIVNNMMRSEQISIQRTPYNMTRRKTVNGQTVEQCYEMVPSLPPATGPILYSDPTVFDLRLVPYESECSLAVTKSHANVSLAEIDGGASIGEAKETFRWIVSLLTRANKLGKGFDRVVRNHSKTGLNMRQYVAKKYRRYIDEGVARDKMRGSFVPLLGTASSAWMEYRYAVRPLLYEMEQARNALAKVLYKKRHTSRGFHRVDTASTASVAGGFPGDFVWTVQTTIARHSNYRAGVMYDVDDDVNTLTAIWGLDNPLSTLWELTRLSFAVDWFYNIGDLIAAWSPKSSLHTLASWVVEEHIFETRIAYLDGVNQYIPSTWFYFGFSPAQLVQKQILRRRTPAPHLSVLPVSRLRLDEGKIIDLAIIGKGLISNLYRK